MLNTIKKTAWIFIIRFFPGEVKMCFGFMSFRAPSTALKQKNYHNSPNMLPILTNRALAVYLGTRTLSGKTISEKLCFFLFKRATPLRKCLTKGRNMLLFSQFTVLVGNIHQEQGILHNCFACTVIEAHR